MPEATTPIADIPPCPLCTSTGGRVIWRAAAWRIAHADSAEDADFPAFYRLICNAHYSEWTDLPEPLQQEGMALLACIETVMRQQLQPHKINLASLGNMVPHLHWHIVARYEWDTHFPGPIWATPRRAADAEKTAALRQQLPNFETALIQALHPWKDKD